ncbi:MAG: glycosyl hydrolase-related protein [Candidatus Latescibacteria bacterium]|jgi:alpha-mannosidase|nr:glycosyl hydrolase-related protein [Candidatus Latescibacterota bacterium]
MAESAMLNQKPVVFDGVRTADASLPCTLESDGISLEVVKKAEKEDCIAIRLVETHGCTSSGRPVVTNGKTKLVETNLMEWTEEGELSCERPVDITLRPFEIRTYKIV